MGYTDIFGGALLFPSQLSYLSITTAVDLTLQWPLEQQVGGDSIVADFLDIDATVPSINIDMPSATATGTGNKVTFNNIGANTFTVRDSTGGTIQSVAPGEQWVVVLRDNTTTAGLWRTFQLGASVSVASASALAGAGIKAIGVTLNQQIDSDVEAATPFTIVDGDRAKCLIYTAGAGTANLTAAATLGNDWFVMLRNSGSGTLNVLPPSGSIDGGASINLEPNDSAFIFTDGTDFFTVGLSSGSTIAFDFVSIAIPGSGDFVLSGANLNRIAYRFTGALTGNRKVVVPNTTQQYWVDNQTTGAFVLSVGTSAQSSEPQVTQANTILLYSDGTDVINAVSSTSVSFPITIGQGGSGATTIAGAQTNLQVPPTSRALLNGFGISATGLGDLSADRTINTNVPTEALAGAVEIATQVEVDAGTDDIRYVTSLKLAAAANVGRVTAAVKTALEQVTASTTLQDDDDLLLAVEANTRYRVELFLQWNQVSTSTNFKFAFTGPASAFMAYRISSADEVSGNALETFAAPSSGLPSAATVPSTATGVISNGTLITGMLETDAAAGTLQLQWAQGNSNANALTLFENSYLVLTKVS